MAAVAPAIDPAIKALPVLGMLALTRPTFAGADMNPVQHALIARIEADPDDASALFDLAILYQLHHEPEASRRMQTEALARGRIFRPLRPHDPVAVRVLALMSPGSFMVNTPIDFLLEDPGFSLDLLYLVPGEPLPERVPDHDVAIVCVSYAQENVPLLEAMRDWTDRWPRPLLNRPAQVLNTAREAVARLLGQQASICIAPIMRLGRDQVFSFDHGYPLIARPVDSHAGDGLEKIDEPAGLAAYLAGHPEPEFYLSQFIDYRGPDGRFVKSRIALIEGRAHLCHLAISDHWMIHYLNAGMREDAAKRAIEAEAMATFGETFALRHAAAFAAMHQRLGLDYVLMDCGETPDGRLLLFEADNVMIIHDLDPLDLFPYKHPHMQSVFADFRQMLRRRAGI